MEPLEYFLPLMNIHITRGEESSGPYSLEEVQAYLAEGILLPDDLAWHEGLENCIPLAELVGQSAEPESAPLPPAPVVAEAVPVEQVPVESMAKPRSRKGLLIAAGAGVAVLVIAAVVWFGFLRPDGSNQEELKVAAGGPKDKGSSTPAPPKTNAPVIPPNPQPAVTNAPVIPPNSQPVVTNAPASPVNPGGNAKPRPPSPTFLAAHKAYQAGKYQEAIKLFETELAAEKEKPKSDELSVGNIHGWLGNSYYLAGLLDKALEYHQKSLAIRLKQLGPNHPDVATSYNNIGLVHGNKGDYDKALEYHQKSLAIQLKQLGPDHLHVATSYGNIGLVHYKKGDYDKALEYYQKSLAIFLKTLGPDHPNVATSYNSIGLVHDNKGDYDQALEYNQKALAILLKTLGPDHPNVATSYNSIGLVHDNKGDYDQALEYHQKALAILLKTLGPDHPNVATSYNHIGLVHGNKAEYDKALEYHQKSLAIQLKQLGPDHPSVALSYNNIGLVHDNKAEYDKALEYHQKSLAIVLKQLGPDHLHVAISYNNIGAVHGNKGDYDKALEYYQKSLAIFLKTLGPDHPNVATSYNHIGLEQHRLKKPNAALAAARKDRRIQDIRLTYMLSFTSERERFAYQRTQRPYSLLGTLGSAPDLALAVLHNKGIILASMLEDQLVAQASKDPAIKALAGQLKSAQHILNKVQLEIPDARKPKAREAHQAQLKAAMAKVEELQQKLARNVKGQGKARRALAIKPADVQKNLAKDEILLEFIRYWHSLGRGQTQERYGVVVLAKEGEAQWVPLGAAKEIDELCQNYGNYLRDRRITDEQYVPLLRSLHDRLMGPIAKVVPKTAKTWIISPASQINFVNFATFLTPKDRFVCEDYTIKYVASGRDLVPPKEKKPKTNPRLVVFANPKYQEKPAVRGVASRELGETILNSGERNDLRAALLLNLSPLPGTQMEADYLEDKAPDWKLEPRIFVGDEAVERQLYKVDSPKVLHLATHGMFLEKPIEKKKSRPGLMAILLGKSSTQRKDFIVRLKNPMQRSALMFTGATWTSVQWAKGIIPATTNDGILTAAEVGTLNLKGTKLVVMSACQTGLGDLRSGEGVMGLRRAFIQAGTENLMMTLWPVSDATSVTVMKKFYEKAMAEDGDAPVALAEVQREGLMAIRKLPQLKAQKIGVKMAVNLAGPFILSFQNEANEDDAAEPPMK
jgi:tetratricopeptide (TPR) repeat protein